METRESHRALAKNLVLVGGRSCGKSSVAKRLARSNRNFSLFSLDALIRYEAGGATIPQIVEREGWSGFRARELEVVRRVSEFEGGALIDTGGGVVVELDADGAERFSEEKVELLRRHGLIVYLERSIAYLESHAPRDPQRPQLSATESFREIIERRDPWYRRAAHYVFSATGLEKDEIAEGVLDWYYRELGIRGD